MRLKYLLLLIFLFLLKSSSGQSDPQEKRSKTSRLILGSTANMLEKGDKLLYNINILYNAFDYGISKNLTIGGGFLIFGDLTSGQIKVKVGHSFNDKIHVALVNHILFPKDRGTNVLSPILALTTIDFNKFSLTFGPGIIFQDAKIILASQVAFVIPIKKNFAFISENYWSYETSNNFDDDKFYLLSLGVRYFYKKWYFDLASSNFASFGNDGDSFIPLASLSVNFKFN